MNKLDIIGEIQRIMPPGAPEPRDPSTLRALTMLSGELVQAYDQDGALDRHPFADVQERTIHRYDTEIRERVEGRTVLITGGEGFVGSELSKALTEFAPGKIVTVDVAATRGDNPTDRQHYQASVGDLDELAGIFDAERPDVVFHLAAEREPERAEQQIENSVRSNVLGTENVIRLCEEFGVGHCVYSSSGKAARYHTPDVYAGSKKMTEWQFAQAAATGDSEYGAVRFTHVMENSIVSREMGEKIDRGLVSFHSPDRIMYVQTKSEAVNLLLNGLAFDDTPECRILTVQDLGWPVEVLTIPLFKMKERGVIVPLYFRGLPAGYESEFFRGQLDLSSPEDLNPMVNAQETPFSRLDASGDMRVTRVAPFSFDALNRALAGIRSSLETGDGAEIKARLDAEIKQVSQTAFERTPTDRGWKILKRGIDPRTQDIGELLEHHADTIELITRGVVPRLDAQQLSEADRTRPTASDMMQVLRKLPSLAPEVALLDQLIED